MGIFVLLRTISTMDKPSSSPATQLDQFVVQSFIAGFTSRVSNRAVLEQVQQPLFHSRPLLTTLNVLCQRDDGFDSKVTLRLAHPPLEE
jgi:hypothetical protein